MSYTNGLDKPSDYFVTKLYSGNGSTQSITGVGFQPDWVWIKNRDATDSHRVTDAVRGVAKELYSNQTYSEDPNGGLTAFDSDGFTLNSNSSYNGNNVNYASWNWLGANGTASNSNGSITSTVSANTTAGFSIVSYTGTGSNATVGHGLGVAPKMIICKARSVGNTWGVYHSSTGNTGALFLDDTSAFSSSSTYWNNTSPTSSLFTISTNTKVNQSSATYIAYCFAEKKGYSKFGSYTGNGNADGTFVYTGFKPAFVMVKRSSGTDNWMITDNKRSSSGGNNVIDRRILPNLSNAEFTNTSPMDLLSNGFKHRDGDDINNASGSTYIYMCFSENPFVTSTGIPTTAR